MFYCPCILCVLGSCCVFSGRRGVFINCTNVVVNRSDTAFENTLYHCNTLVCPCWCLHARHNTEFIRKQSNWVLRKSFYVVPECVWRDYQQRHCCTMVDVVEIHIFSISRNLLRSGADTCHCHVFAPIVASINLHIPNT